jgi:hypothetical protein
MRANSFGRIEHTSKRRVHRLPSRKRLSDFRLEYNNVAFSSQALYILTPNTAPHRRKVIFSAHVIILNPICLFHRIAFLEVLPLEH